MKLSLTNRVTEIPDWDDYDYVITRFDDGIKYGVWEGGNAPLNGGRKGTYIGQVARYDYIDGEWYAAPNYGSQDAVDLKWYGPFSSRVRATTFLSGLDKGHAAGINEIAEG